jgi:hypothetical protein
MTLLCLGMILCENKGSRMARFLYDGNFRVVGQYYACQYLSVLLSAASIVCMTLHGVISLEC